MSPLPTTEISPLLPVTTAAATAAPSTSYNQHQHYDIAGLAGESLRPKKNGESGCPGNNHRNKAKQRGYFRSVSASFREMIAHHTGE
jgi:hypothetical protein